MRTLLSPLFTASVFVFLLASCSSVEPDSEGPWSGVWTYQSETAHLEASLVQRGDDLSGTIEQIFRGGGSPHATDYMIEGIVSENTATGHLVVGAERHPMKLVRQNDAIRFEVVSWSWQPVLKRKAQ